jgi:hypothetical protein
MWNLPGAVSRTLFLGRVIGHPLVFIIVGIGETPAVVVVVSLVVTVVNDVVDVESCVDNTTSRGTVEINSEIKLWNSVTLVIILGVGEDDMTVSFTDDFVISVEVCFFGSSSCSYEDSPLISLLVSAGFTSPVGGALVALTLCVLLLDVMDEVTVGVKVEDVPAVVVTFGVPDDNVVEFELAAVVELFEELLDSSVVSIVDEPFIEADVVNVDEGGPVVVLILLSTGALFSPEP